MSLTIHRQLMLLASCISAFGCVDSADGVDQDQAKPAPPEWSQWDLFSSTFFEPPQDILWVINNSGSMCQEQKLLRDNFDQFIDVLKDTTRGFHVAVTTTHAPSADTPVVTESVAEEARIQSTPQPVPGFDTSCIADSQGGFTPLRDALNGALDCLADESKRAQFNWSDEQIKCAREGVPANCGMTLNIADRNGDANISIEDLFPDPADYRTLPKVLKSEAYRMGDGTLDVPKLKRDFGCMSLVGTRGDGFERGLQAAVEAVSPELTAPTKPNHGFLSAESRQLLIFVTDGDDCSSASLDRQASSSCQTLWCGDDPAHPLFSAPQLAASLRVALSSSLGVEQDALDVGVASIHGAVDRGQPKPPSCESMTHAQLLEELATCDNVASVARAGERYERFMRQFAQYFPSSASRSDPLNFDLLERGWMCSGNFAPALIAIAEFIGTQSSCLERGQALIMVLSPGLKGEQPHPYCEAPPVPGYGCVVDPKLYERRPCVYQEGDGVSFRQNYIDLRRELSGQTLELWVPPRASRSDKDPRGS